MQIPSPQPSPQPSSQTPQSQSRPTLSREAIKSCNDLPAPLPLYIPEWGGNVWIRHLNAKELDDWDAYVVSISKSIEDGKVEQDIDDVGTRARYTALVCCDEHGTRTFHKNDAVWLALKFGRALDRIYSEGHKINRTSALEKKELEKNSDSAAGDGELSS